MTRSPVSASWSQSEVSGLERIAAEPRTTRWAISAISSVPAISRPNSRRAVALSASRRWASYRRAFSSATEACPASTSSTRRSSASNWSRPSFEITITPFTCAPNLKRDGEQRLLDLGRAGDLLAELAVGGVSDEQWLAGLCDAARDAAADDGGGAAQPRRRDRLPSARRGRRAAAGRRRRGRTRGSCGNRSGGGARRRS